MRLKLLMTFAIIGLIGSSYGEVTVSTDSSHAAELPSSEEVLVLQAPAGFLKNDPTFPQINSLKFSPDGHRILSTQTDSAVRIWDIKTGKNVLTFSGHTDATCFAMFTRDGKRVVSSGYDKMIREWDAITGQEIKVFKGHTDAVHQLVLSNDEKTLFSASADKTARMWDVDGAKEIKQFIGYRSELYTLALSKDGSRLLTGAEDNVITEWDVSKAKPVQFYDMAVIRSGVAFSPDEREVICSTNLLNHDCIYVFDRKTGEIKRSFKERCDFNSLTITKDGHYAVGGLWSKTGCIVDLRNMSLKWEAKSDNLKTIHCSALSPDEKLMAFGCRDGTIHVWKMPDLDAITIK